MLFLREICLNKVNKVQKTEEFPTDIAFEHLILTSGSSKKGVIQQQGTTTTHL